MGSKETTVADVSPQAQDVDQPDPLVNDADPETLGDQQIIHANLSGH